MDQVPEVDHVVRGRRSGTLVRLLTSARDRESESTQHASEARRHRHLPGDRRAHANLEDPREAGAGTRRLEAAEVGARSCSPKTRRPGLPRREPGRVRDRDGEVHPALPVRPAADHSSGMVKLLMNVGGSPLKAGIFARRNTMRTQLPVSVSRNFAVKISTDWTWPSFE